MHPAERLQQLASETNLDVNSREFAEFLDRNDELQGMRERFLYPKKKDLPNVDLSLIDGDEDSVYLCSNSYGLQPKSLRDYLNRQLDKWAKYGVYGHFQGELPWAFCDEAVKSDSAKLVGAFSDEVAIMSSLTINLHLLLVAFYQPTEERHIILLEDKAFPSDHYAFQSQIRLRGFDPDKSLLCLKPRDGEYTLRTEDILEVIRKRGKEIAVICFGVVQYYTGQLFDMAAIAKAGQEQGCYVGFNLAHAVGNVELFLHDWGVDFACWCTYKYLCSGAGGIGGAFLHNKHRHTNFTMLEGWWGHKSENRFLMNNQMERAEGISGFRVSNPSILQCAALRASLDAFVEAGGMAPLRKKSILLTGYMEMLLKEMITGPNSSNADKAIFEIITPNNPSERGSQLSLLFSFPVDVIRQELDKRGIVCDERKPNVLRFAPVAMYNSFLDIYRFIEVLKTLIPK